MSDIFSPILRQSKEIVQRVWYKVLKEGGVIHQKMLSYLSPGNIILDQQQLTVKIFF